MRVAIAGAGLMGRWHARYARAAGATVAAVVEPNPDAAKRLTRKKNGCFSQLSEALAQVPLDAVHICTPSDTHAELVDLALRSDCHVLVEKPVGEDASTVEELVSTARRQGRVLTPVHQFPFQPGAVDLLASRRKLGDLVRLGFTICSAGGEGREPAERRRILLEMLPHPLSLFRPWLKALPREWNVLHFDADDLELSARAEGVQLGITLSLRARPTRNEMTVTGTAATGHLDLFHGYGLLEARTPNRATKALAPFQYGGKLLATASANLLGRAVSERPAYPGLAELIAGFYRSCRRPNRWIVEPDEIRDIAVIVDEVRRR